MRPYGGGVDVAERQLGGREFEMSGRPAFSLVSGARASRSPGCACGRAGSACWRLLGVAWGAGPGGCGRQARDEMGSTSSLKDDDTSESGAQAIIGIPLGISGEQLDAMTTKNFILARDAPATACQAAERSQRRAGLAGDRTYECNSAPNIATHRTQLSAPEPETRGNDADDGGGAIAFGARVSTKGSAREDAASTGDHS